MVYRRYASLFFIAGCASTDNELITLEIVHRYVEQMDKYYGNVCELDIIFNFQKAYFILDELLLAGEMQESSKKNVLRVISQQDSLEDMEVSTVDNVAFLAQALNDLVASYTVHESAYSMFIRGTSTNSCSPANFRSRKKSPKSDDLPGTEYSLTETCFSISLYPCDVILSFANLRCGIFRKMKTPSRISKAWV